MNEKLPPLFPTQTPDNCSKFISQTNTPDFYQEPSQVNGPQSINAQSLNLPQSPIQSEYNSSQFGPKQAHLNNFVEVGSYGRKDWLAWSVVSLVIFFPLFIFWVPALICSISARNKFITNDIKGGKLMSNIALILNIACLVFACVGYLCALIVPLTVASNACEENVCFRYCNFIKTKYVCYDDYTSYVQEINPMYYSNCKYSYYSGTYLCLTDYKFVQE